MRILTTPRLTAPELNPWEWSTERREDLASRRGRVVLVHFFSWARPEWVAELPRLLRLADHYRSHGLEVLGIHSAEEDFERPTEISREEIWRLGIAFPVGFDLGGEMSTAYENHSLPATYLVDRQGMLRGWHHEPRATEQLEPAVRFLLEEGSHAPEGPPLPEPTFTLQDTLRLASSPPLHFALPEGPGQPAPGIRTFGELPELRTPGVPSLEGSWDLRLTRVVSASTGARLAVVFEGRRVLACLGPDFNASEPLVVEGTLDGEPITPVTIDRPQVYDLARSETHGLHHLDLRVSERGLSVHRIYFDSEL